MSTIDQNWWTSATHDGQPMPEILAAHEFGKVFAFLRARGWSLAAITARTGIDEYRIREYIRGNRKIEKHRLIERIADGLEIDRRLCRVADFSNEDEHGDTRSPLHRGADELRDLLAQANSLDQDGLRLLAEQTNHVRKVDRGFGADASDRQIRAHLDTLLALRSFSLLPANRQRLADLFCDAAALAGWVALDLGDLTAAWRHHEAAKDAGRETGSAVALTHALAQQAYVLLDIGNAAQAVQLSEYALSLAYGAVPPVLMAWLYAVVGEMQGIVGEERLSKSAFDQAANLLPADPVDPSVPYIMLNEFHLARWRGAGFARLGDEAAIDEMHYALTGMDATWTRAKAQ
ncbi:MAG: helix-turn-helix transcriptional regulator, partial [Kribbellaceae bacterium]|nr:helix-turn-helix transcriptional regulator [Kribbellaceae bacterium]